MEVRFIDLNQPDLSPKRSVLSLGGFDGIHLGHQALIRKLIEVSKDRQAPSCLCLFDPLPFQVLEKKSEFKRLFAISELGDLLKGFGLDFLCIIPFDGSFSRLSSKDFIQSVLIHHFDPLHVIVGYDFSFSYQKSGNFSILKSYGQKFGFSVEKVKPCLYKGGPISSSRIRTCLSLSDMEGVRALLGRSFSIQSQVVRGDGRGRQLGFPTANLKPEQKELPPFGVYAGRARIQENWLPAVVNIGCRPSFNGSQFFVEIHIPSFSRDIYNQILKVELDYFIRKEKAFSKLSDLKKQMRRDVQTVLI